MTTLPNLPVKERAEFKIVREEWSEYKTTGELRVKVKTSISEIFDIREPNAKKGRLEFETTSSFFKEPSPDDKGEPSADQKITDEDVIEKLPLEKISEPLNIYDVIGKVIVTQQTKLNYVTKTRKFDSNGTRIYQYDVGCQLTLTPYPDFPKVYKVEAEIIK